jgi:hypothetical protein
MADQWYYTQQGQRKGPVPEEQIRQLMSSGQMQLTDLVWKQGMVQWTQASQIFSSPPLRKVQGMWSRLTTLQKALVAGGIAVVGVVLLSCLGIFGIGGKKHDTSISEWNATSESIDVALAKADQQWDAGKKAEAFDGYMNLISGGAHTFRLGHSRDLPRLYRRVIDYQVEKAGPESARELIRDALRKNVVLTLSSPEANAIVAEERPAAENEIAKEAERQDKRRNPSMNENMSGGKGSTEPIGSASSQEEMNRLFEILFKQVRPGMSSDRILALMGPPHKKEQKDLSDIGGQVMEIWTYHLVSDENNFIILIFKGGVLDSGGSPGYDIKTGRLKAVDDLEDLLNKSK